MKFLFIFFGLSGFCLLGQEQNNTVNSPNQVKVDPISEQKRISELEDKVILLEKRIDQSNEELNDLKKSHKKILDQSNVLQSEIKTSSTKSEKGLNLLKQTLNSQSDVLQSEIKTSSTKSEESLTSLKQALSSKIYWVLGILILLAFLGSYVYRMLSGRIHYLRDQIVTEKLNKQSSELDLMEYIDFSSPSEVVGRLFLIDADGMFIEGIVRSVFKGYLQVCFFIDGEMVSREEVNTIDWDEVNSVTLTPQVVGGY